MMKKNWALLSLVLLMAMMGCTKDDFTEETQLAMEANVQAGTWRITNFNDSGTDKTANFNGFEFTFADNGTLTATDGTSTYTGTWSISDSNSDDDTIDDLDFNIAFTSPLIWEELTDDWDIVSQSDVKIELNDISGGNGGTDLLTFEKN